MQSSFHYLVLKFFILLVIIHISFILKKNLAPPVSPYLLALDITIVFYIIAVVVGFSDFIIKFSLCQFGDNIMEVRKEGRDWVISPQEKQGEFQGPCLGVATVGLTQSSSGSQYFRVAYFPMLPRNAKGMFASPIWFFVT